jgi:23S rRNA pseudouridine1911/1915/1917 synthase
VILPPSAKGERFDRAIRAALGEQGREVSVREVRRALDEGLIRIGGRKIAPGARAAGGESIELDRFVGRSEASVAPEPELLDRIRIIHHDERLLVLDKPSGMPTQPLSHGERGTLLAAALAIAPSIAEAGPPLEGGLLHRLDVETSGLVMFALQGDLRLELRRAFSEHHITKRYLALVRGAIAEPCVVEGAIAPGPTSDRVRVVDPADPKGQPARTEVEPIRWNGDRMLVRATTQYGRRHQVRAHLASIGLPILGDRIYGDPAFPRLALHASEILLPGGETFVSTLPAELEL